MEQGDPIIDREPTPHEIRVGTPIVCDCGCGSVIQAQTAAWTRDGGVARVPGYMPRRTPGLASDD